MVEEAACGPLDILIVDDKAPNLLALEATLEPLGERIVRARSGMEALAAVERQSFALILLDVRMPELDGFEVAALIRKHPHGRETPIIFLTAVGTDPADARRGLSLGAVDYILKPFDPAVLRHKVQSFLALHRERESRRQAETALRTKDLILGVIGHDLLSPVTAVQASALIGLRDPATSRESFERIVVCAKRMHRMITSLVDYAQTQHVGKLLINAAPARMDQLCRQVIEEVRTLHSERNIELQIDGDTSGSWDGDRVIQAVGNLVMNALKHSEGDVRVHVNGRSHDVVVGIESEGKPFPDSVRARLFTPFQKGDPHERGLGLGLFIVQQIAVAHGASVALVTPPNDRRTHFVVRWPRTPPQNKEA